MATVTAVIQNLNQLKKAMKAKQKFVIEKHWAKPSLEGQVRTPNVIQTNGIYSIIEGEPDSPITKANGGKGYWLAYETAKNWEFDKGICTLYVFHKKPDGLIIPIPIIAIRVLEEV